MRRTHKRGKIICCIGTVVECLLRNRRVAGSNVIHSQSPQILFGVGYYELRGRASEWVGGWVRSV